MSGGKWCKSACASAVLGCALMAMLPVSMSRAQDDAVSGRNGDETQKETPASDKRYALVKSGDDILRIDREAGSVSFCRKSNDIWRCMPAPLAEEAYQAEIASLADEVDRLTARIQELEGATEAPGEKGAAKSPSEAPSAVPPSAVSPKANDPSRDKPSVSGGKTDRSPKRLSEEDEEQLEEVLQFSEKAMRRFFGLMKDLRDEMDQPGGG
jgi:hypothetical protein